MLQYTSPPGQSEKPRRDALLVRGISRQDTKAPSPRFIPPSAAAAERSETAKQQALVSRSLFGVLAGSTVGVSVVCLGSLLLNRKETLLHVSLLRDFGKPEMLQAKIFGGALRGARMDRCLARSRMHGLTSHGMVRIRRGSGTNLTVAKKGGLIEVHRTE